MLYRKEQYLINVHSQYNCLLQRTYPLEKISLKPTLLVGSGIGDTLASQIANGHPFLPLSHTTKH